MVDVLRASTTITVALEKNSEYHSHAGDRRSPGSGS
nr:hypothetical protein [Methanobacterium formicicum]